MKIKLIALTAVLLAGCADEPVQSSGPPVHKGESRAQVEARLGRSSDETTNSSGALVCTYWPGSAKGLIPIWGGFAEQKAITVRYSRAGYVIAWEYQSFGM
jgi:hypothetical protein